MCHFDTSILEWVLPVAVLFNLMVDFEVLVLMVPSAKNTISNYLKILHLEKKRKEIQKHLFLGVDFKVFLSYCLSFEGHV